MAALCSECGAQVDIDFTAGPIVINRPNISILIFEHTKPAICPGCLKKVALSVQQAMGLMVAAVPLPEEKKILTFDPRLTV